MEEYTGLISRDDPALTEAGDTITIRFEVNASTLLVDTAMLIDRKVARIPVRGFPGKPIDMTPPRGC